MQHSQNPTQSMCIKRPQSTQQTAILPHSAEQTTQWYQIRPREAAIVADNWNCDVTRTARSPYITSSDNCIIAKTFHNVTMVFLSASHALWLRGFMQCGVYVKIPTLSRCDVHYRSREYALAKWNYTFTCLWIIWSYLSSIIARIGLHGSTVGCVRTHFA